jgi:outer membrane protein assembly factor BamB
VTVACDVTTSVAVADDDVYVGCGDGRLFRLSAGTGSERSRIRLPAPPEGRLAVLEDRIIVPAGRDWIGAVDRELSTVLWEHRPWSPLSVVQPLVWGNVVLTGNGKGQLIALDVANGATAWVASLTGSIRGLGHHDGILLVGTIEGMLYALRTESLHR